MVQCGGRKGGKRPFAAHESMSAMRTKLPFAASANFRCLRERAVRPSGKLMGWMAPAPTSVVMRYTAGV